MNKTRIQPVYLDTIIYQSRKGSKRSLHSQVRKEQIVCTQKIIANRKIRSFFYFTSGASVSLFLACVVFNITILMEASRGAEKELDNVEKSIEIKKTNSFSDETTKNNLTIPADDVKEVEVCTSRRNLSGVLEDDNKSPHTCEQCFVFYLVDYASKFQPDTLRHFLTYSAVLRRFQSGLSTVECIESFYLNNTEMLTQPLPDCNLSMGIPQRNLFTDTTEDLLTEVTDATISRRKESNITITFLILSFISLVLTCLYFSLHYLRKTITSWTDIQTICNKVDSMYVQVSQERFQSENLLYQMLPHSVADNLIAGRQIEAETFDEVSVYFSDIIGFNDVALSAAPIQIVNLLNSIYGLVSTYFC